MICNIYNLAEQCLFTANIDEKIQATHTAARLYQAVLLDFTASKTVKPAKSVVFPDKPQLVMPRDLPRRRLSKLDGQIALLHAVAHIEFSAIHLAWDHLYRFQNMPNEYVTDWLGVAIEEAEHFSLLRNRINELGADYGDFPAHRGLWELAEDTADDILARMALIPRFMEARGLDVTPTMITKLKNLPDPQSAHILQRILDDEVGHVSLGSKWYHYLCREQQIPDHESTYFALIKQYLRQPSRGPYNKSLRQIAGFSESELNQLEHLNLATANDIN